MSIINLLTPNNYNLYAGSITSSSQTIGGNLNVTGNLLVDGSTVLHNLTTGTGALVSLEDGTIVFNNSNVILSGATAVDLNLSQLSDTAISSPSANQLLVYNGTKWANGIQLLSGSFTPTLANITNTSNVSFNSAFYVQAGNIVTVYLNFFYTPTATNTLSAISVTLPVPRSNFSSNPQAIGNITQVDSASNYRVGFYLASIGQQQVRAQMDGVPTAGTVDVYGSFQYII